MPENNITFKFHNSYKPSLESGVYTFNVTQNIKVQADIQEEFLANTLEIHIQGPKFSLSPEMIHHTYPSPGLNGDFEADLPSIVFNRLSLPWERETTSGKSWLMLLLLNEDDLQRVKEGESVAKELFDNVETEHQDTNVKYIEIDNFVKEKYFTDQADVDLLTYCRSEQSADSISQDSSDKAVLLSNRLPTPGQTNTVYLVSRDHKNTSKNSKLTYAYLYKWQFFCRDQSVYIIPKETEEQDNIPTELRGRTFEGTDTLKTDLRAIISNKIKDENEIERIEQLVLSKYRNDNSFHGFLHALPNKLDTLKFPIKAEVLNKIDNKAQDLINQGGLLLKNENEVNVYRGVLQANPTNLILPRDLYQMIIQASKTGQDSIGDLSYKIAYELGKLTALNDIVFNKSFYAWKQEVSMNKLIENKHKNYSKHGHLKHLSTSMTGIKEIPPIVFERVTSWELLKQIPYSYLIPTSKMVPQESIRCFYCDCNWINAFLLGAFSIGSNYPSIEQDMLDVYIQKELFLTCNRFGFIINSYVVSNWKDYRVRTDAQVSLNLLERKLLAKNMELFVFEGQDLDREETNINIDRFKALTFYLPGGSTHSGFIKDGLNFIKKINDDTIVLAFRGDIRYRVIDANKLCEEAVKKMNDPRVTINNFGSARFGRMMLESIPEVKFTIS